MPLYQPCTHSIARLSCEQNHLVTQRALAWTRHGTGMCLLGSDGCQACKIQDCMQDTTEAHVHNVC